MSFKIPPKFSIKSILTKNEENCFSPFQNSFILDPLQPQQPSLTSQTTQIVTPTLAELQIFFGLNVRKHEYSRSRRRNVERKPRQAYTEQQLNTLEQAFMEDKYLSVQKRVQLAVDLMLSETQIKTWFQNRRTKWKKQLTDSLRQIYQQRTNI
uniref:Homeobox domain-containing protein n=1 Tax=Meloidogyne floridensis TaxID=298350 RepID=A0A915PB16_9BILA